VHIGAMMVGAKGNSKTDAVETAEEVRNEKVGEKETTTEKRVTINVTAAMPSREVRLRMICIFICLPRLSVSESECDCVTYFSDD
jgi:hypothetical protein